MTDLSERYDAETAAAWILGHARRTSVPLLPEELGKKTADECTDGEREFLLRAGLDAGLKLYPFKRGTMELARTRRTLGFLHSLSFESMLDVGSGRGVFLLPFLKEFPWVRVTSVDILEKRVVFLGELADGGFPLLSVERRDICGAPYPENSFDVVTMLEVLEHIPDVGAAVRNACRIARRCVIVTVPSKPDDNPEHIHLLTRPKLEGLFQAAGCRALRFDAVPGHLVLFAKKGA